jgi:phosphohistidine phosphatase
VKHLLLLRHAKSSWSDSQVPDEDRPLSARGERAALVMGRYLRQQGIPIDLALCSPARRTLETWALAATQIDELVPTETDSALYMQGHDAILSRIAQVPDSLAAVIVVGHNPDLERLAVRLAAEADEDTLSEMRRKYPTGGLARYAFDTERWADVPNEAGTLLEFVVPKQLV